MTYQSINPSERHRSGRARWLRAAVLGSDDAIVSTASLMIGVAASSASRGRYLGCGSGRFGRRIDVDGCRRICFG